MRWFLVGCGSFRFTGIVDVNVRFLTSFFFLSFVFLTVGCEPNHEDKRPPVDFGLTGGASPGSRADARDQARDGARKISDDAWLEAGVGEKDLREIAGSRCYFDEVEFLSCVSGLSTAFAGTGENIQFGPKEFWPAVASDVQKIDREFGSFQVVEVKLKTFQPDASLRSFFVRNKLERQRLQRITRALFAKRDLDFESAVTYLLERARSKASPRADAFLFRDFVNSYLSVRDFVASLQPTAEYKWKEKQTSSKSIDWGENIFVDHAILVKYLRPDSPAAKAGLRQGDKIRSVDGAKIKDLSVEEMAMIFGRLDGDSVVVEVDHANGVKASLSLPLESSVRSSLEYRKIVHAGKQFRLVRIRTFDTEKICDLLQGALIEDARTGGSPDGYVIDLRGNLGGRLDQTVCIATLFLGDAKVVSYVKDLDSTEKVPRTTFVPPGFNPDWLKNSTSAPLIVLSDRKSASGSEMLMGALRDHSRALIVGQRSFGKGTVNMASPWDARKKLVIWKTKAVFYLPSLRTHNRVGLQPDITVPWRTGAAADEDFFPTSEDTDSNPTQPENAIVEPKDVARTRAVDQCLDRTWILDEEKRLFGTLAPSDLPLLFGVEALRCMVQTR